MSTILAPLPQSLQPLGSLPVNADRFGNFIMEFKLGLEVITKHISILDNNIVVTSYF
jgi:hypothetical protein